ncbi:MAG: adenylate/guanylate cyclase domain-containing protein [Chloroflexi bacterium]|nr:adenylate/guanylate cyclase domain-containing protein [Chloroflexota bacterium]
MQTSSQFSTLFRKLWRRAFSPRGIRRFQVGAAMGLLIGLLIAGILSLGALKPFEAGLADWFYRPRPTSGNVVLIAVDDETADTYGWPLERITQRGFVGILARFQPRVIVLDMVLPDIGAALDDDLLAAMLSRAGKVVQPVLGVEATRLPSETSPFPAFDSIVTPAPTLRTPNTILAHGALYPDADGVVRRVPLAIDVPGQRYPALALAAVALFEGREPTVELAQDGVRVGDKRVPVDARGQVLISFSRRDAIKIISYADIMQGKADYSQLRDKIVLVGPMTRAINETYAVPAGVESNRVYNVQIQADAIETLLSGNYLREEDRTWQIAAVLVIAIFAGVTLPRMPWLYGAVFSIGILAAYLLYASVRAEAGVIITPLYAGIALVVTYMLAVTYRYFSEERTRAFISRIFQGRIAPESVSQVIDLYAQGALSLAGGRREVTVMCATLRGIATLSEATAPETVIELLDRHNALIVETIFRLGGAVTSQIGNTVIATWNFPLAQPDHATRALQAAFAIQQQMRERNPETTEEQEIGAAIGLATGAVVVGQLSSLQTEYSVVGDVVTLSERITALAAPGQVLISTETREQIGKEWNTEHIHSLRTRGKKDPILVWQVEDAPSVG